MESWDCVFRSILIQTRYCNGSYCHLHLRSIYSIESQTITRLIHNLRLFVFLVYYWCWFNLRSYFSLICNKWNLKEKEKTMCNGWLLIEFFPLQWARVWICTHMWRDFWHTICLRHFVEKAISACIRSDMVEHFMNKWLNLIDYYYDPFFYSFLLSKFHSEIQKIRISPALRNWSKEKLSNGLWPRVWVFGKVSGSMPIEFEDNTISWNFSSTNEYQSEIWFS